MALSTPGTPRNHLQIPKRITLATSEKKFNGASTTPKTCFTTPKSHYATPRSTKKSNNNISSTPECFSNVTLETPIASNTRHRASKDKYDEVSNLTVAVRIRPMNSRELALVGMSDVVRVRDQDLIIRSQAHNNSMSTDHIFQYDHIFWSCDETHPVHSCQEEVFLTMGKPLLNNVFRGYNACLFAYGQTGSGKSYSMMGKNVGDLIDIDSEEFSGITPRFCRDLFQRIAQLEPSSSATVEVSYFEIYNEKIHDLLASATNGNRAALKVREHPVWGPYVVDLSVHTVKSYKELRNFLLLGNKNRVTAATAMNEKSSRSHSIFSIELGLSEGEDEGSSRRSRISLVDLAGSERLGNNYKYNTEEKIKQGVYINKSLLVLGKVISALADQKKNQFVPYRDSVLTWLLRESLGGNSLTSMLATITPASSHLEETLATLRYACQARAIVNRARINENPHDRLIRELRTEVERLRALRQDYERSASTSTSSILSLDDNSRNDEELNELRHKLTETETKLLEAQNRWEQRFMESQETQQKELAEAERYRAELESKVRIMKTADNNVNLSPYKTNFIEELKDVLTVDDVNINLEFTDESCAHAGEVIRNICNWCTNNGYNYAINPESLLISDPSNDKEALVTLTTLSLSGFENICDFIKSLRWTSNGKKQTKKLTKTEVSASMNQIYKLLATLKPNETETNLSLLFAKVNKSLQSFEAALLNNVKTCKSVKFDINTE